MRSSNVVLKVTRPVLAAIGAFYDYVSSYFRRLASSRHARRVLHCSVIVGTVMVFAVLLAAGAGIVEFGRAANSERMGEEVILVTAMCGDRKTTDALTMLKSALLFTRSRLKLVIFTEIEQVPRLTMELTKLVSATNKPHTFEFYQPKETAIQTKGTYGAKVRLCASQRLFFPSVLKNMDAVIWVDADIIFLGPVEQLWRNFELFDSKQLAGIAMNSANGADNWYKLMNVKFPIYKELALNNGVYLMNLTRMRERNFEALITKVYQKYSKVLLLVDQDLLNIIFHFFPDLLFELPCRFNFFQQYCNFPCESAEKLGINLVHGLDNNFHSGKVMGLMALHKAFVEYELGTDPYENLVIPLAKNMDLPNGTDCGNIKDLVLKTVEAGLPER